ncbi:MAG: molecular chaperone HtpG [Anaerolineae bacterium]|nr:molecular chaperone HtpG [Anaerolineae bacterium]
MTQDTNTQSFEFKAEIQQLLNILVHSLYTEREIFLRELISNAADALNRIQFIMLTDREVLDPDAELAVHVSVDEEKRTLTISDRGVGMTRDEVVQDLGTIAHSGAAAFVRQLEEQARPDVEMIGQFGVGFYSVFMVADRVRVVSRSYRPGAEAVEWVSEGSAEYRVGPAEKETRGTRIEVHLKEDAAEFAQMWRLEQAIKKHSNFVAFPIYLEGRDEPVNRRTPLWRKSPQEVTGEQYVEFYRQMTLDFEEPLLHTHLVTDAPVSVRSIVYVPAKRDRGLLDLRGEHGLRLYIRNVLIQEHNRDLLPNYLRFVEGVVESEDLPLNISRETVQSSPAGRRVQRALTRKLLRELETTAADAPDRYVQFWREFGPFLKEGAVTDPATKNDLLPLLRFHSSRSGEGLTSLAEYVERMGEGQDKIYYVLGEDLRSVARSPHLDYFFAHDVEVLYLVDPIDSFVMVSLHEYEGKPLRNVDDAELELPQAEAEAAEGTLAVPEVEFNRLVSRCVQVLGDRVIEVRESKVLRDSPVRLVSPDDTPGREMSRVARLLGQEFEVPKRILEVNRRHPIVANLAHLVTDNPQAPAIDPTIELLYENQLLLEGLHPNPAEMIPRIQQLMEAATGGGTHAAPAPVEARAEEGDGADGREEAS